MGDEFDEEGMEIEDDEVGYKIFESNKRVSFYVIDGGKTMFEKEGDEEDVPFKRAIKAVYNQMLKLGCSGALNHLVSVIIANTASSHPTTLGVDKFHELLDLDFIGQESVMALKKFIDADSIENMFKEKFEGHSACDLGDIVYYLRRNAQRKTTTKRELSVYYLTNNPNPFGKNPTSTTHFRQLQKHVMDLASGGGQFAVLFMSANEDTSIWKYIDPSVSNDSIAELESKVYQKAFQPRAYSTLAFSVAPGITLDVGLYTMASETKKPSPMYFDLETEERVYSRTVYRPAKPKEETENTTQLDEPTNGTTVEGKTQFEFSANDRSRSELKQAIELGGEKILFEQKELAQLKRFDKGLVLLGFKPLSLLPIQYHVEPDRFIYPSEGTMVGSRRLYRALLERCAARQQMIICYCNAQSHTRPRLVALVPHTEGVYEGFHVVALPFADDVVDTRELQVPVEVDETPDQKKATQALVKKLTNSYEPFDNPHLQSFYSMLIEYAVGEKPEVEDNLKPYFEKEENEEKFAEVDGEFVSAFGLEGFDPNKKRTPVKRKAAGEKQEAGRGAKKDKKDPASIDLKAMAEDGTLKSLSVAELRGHASLNEIRLSGLKKKDEIIQAITDFYAEQQ